MNAYNLGRTILNKVFNISCSLARRICVLVEALLYRIYQLCYFCGILLFETIKLILSITWKLCCTFCITIIPGIALIVCALLYCAWRLSANADEAMFKIFIYAREFLKIWFYEYSMERQSVNYSVNQNVYQNVNYSVNQQPAYQSQSTTGYYSKQPSTPLKKSNVASFKSSIDFD